MGLGRGRGHPSGRRVRVTALTLPGLESNDADRSSVTLGDHVRAVVDAIRAAGGPSVLVVHSAAGYSGYAASDRMPERIAGMVYVDTAPGISPLDPTSKGSRSLSSGRTSRQRRTSRA